MPGEVFELGAFVHDQLFGIFLVALVAMEVGLRVGERVVGVRRDAADDVLNVAQVGSRSVAGVGVPKASGSSACTARRVISAQ